MMLLVLVYGCAAPRPELRGEALRLARIEARLAARQFAAVDASGYATTKADAWYEFAYDAHAQGDRTGVVDEALDEAAAILQRIEAHGNAIPVQAPSRLSRMVRVREDLWGKIATQEQHEHFACAQSSIARASVQLLEAGHAYNDLGWRAARPYVQAAERYVRKADAQIRRCGGAQEQGPEVDDALERSQPVIQRARVFPEELPLPGMNAPQ
jgi:hypothetical protein